MSVRGFSLAAFAGTLVLAGGGLALVVREHLRREREARLFGAILDRMGQPSAKQEG